MRLEDQVCALAQSQRLYQLGLESESQFYWVKEKGTISFFLMSDHDYSYSILKGKELEAYRAYTVSEMGAILPNTITDGDIDYEIMQTKTIRDYYLIEIVPQKRFGFQRDILSDFASQIEAHARAECLIFSLANKHISPNDIKL